MDTLYNDNFDVIFNQRRMTRVTLVTSVGRYLLTKVIWNVTSSTCVQTALAARGNVRIAERRFSIRVT